MSFAVDIVLVSNIDKCGAGTECLVGLPIRNPWSLPFAHKKLFADRCDRYDLFIYSEDDILITEDKVRAWLEVSESLADDEIAGFLRFETGSNGERSYPDAHAHFHWDPGSVRRRGRHTLAHFTNEHAACYVLTRDQLRKVLDSGGFDVQPHEGKYDLLCTAATDPYTQCGLTKLIPVSNLDAFSVHHMSNRYVGKMGMNAEQFGRQIDAMLRIAHKGEIPKSLFPTETRLWRGAYSKDYYEPANEQVTSLVPKTARKLLSIGCGLGLTERLLAEKGCQVSAIPLDPIFAESAAGSGIEMIHEDLERELDCKDKFDCVLLLNVLHLVPEPQKLLSFSQEFMHSRSTLIVQTPNMMSLRALRHHLRGTPRLMPFSDYGSTRAHFSSARTVRNWFINSGLRVEKMIGVRTDAGDGMLGRISSISDNLPRTISLPLATSIVITGTKTDLDAHQIA